MEGKKKETELGGGESRKSCRGRREGGKLSESEW